MNPIMETKKSLKEILKTVLEQYGIEDKILSHINHKYMLHIDELSPQYQYLEDGSLNESCVEECLEKSIEIYEYVNFSNNLLVVYENLYGIDNENEKKFLESTFTQISESESYKLKWKFPNDENDLPIHIDDEIYTCIRYLYNVKEIDINKLFKQIILSEIGGDMNFCSSVFIIDIDSSLIFHLYDDRGIYVYDLEEKNITSTWKRFNENVFTLDYQNFKIEIEDLHLIDKIEDKIDEVLLIGNITLSLGDDKRFYEGCNISSAALGMLKILDEDDILIEGLTAIRDYKEFIIFSKSLDRLNTLEYDNELDWTFLYEDGMIKVTDEKGNTRFIYYLQYKKEVLRFADIIEDYYKKHKR